MTDAYDWAADVRIYRQHLARWIVVGHGGGTVENIAELTACAEALLARMAAPRPRVVPPPDWPTMRVAGVEVK